MRGWRSGLELCGKGPIRGPQAQKATIMSAQPQNDGRAAVRTRSRSRKFTGRPDAGRRWAGRAFQSLVVAAALAVLGVTVGGGSASAATATPAARSTAATITGVTWHQLNLINGWQSGQSQFAGDGVPAWTVQNGVVYLSGSVVQTSGTNNEFAVLPPAARPSRVLYMTVFTVAGTQGFIIVHPSGAIQAWATPYSNAQGLTSLAGVSYPAPALATHKLALENGWQSSQSQWGTGDPSYSVSNGVVYLSGSLLQPSATATGQMFAVLPNAARPVHYLYIKAMVWSPGSVANTGTVVITPNGEMYAYSLTASEAQQYTSLAGISYPLGS